MCEGRGAKPSIVNGLPFFSSVISLFLIVTFVTFGRVFIGAVNSDSVSSAVSVISTLSSIFGRIFLRCCNCIEYSRFSSVAQFSAPFLNDFRSLLRSIKLRQLQSHLLTSDLCSHVPVLLLLLVARVNCSNIKFSISNSNSTSYSNGVVDGCAKGYPPLSRTSVPFFFCFSLCILTAVPGQNMPFSR
jgi:hypothetical protein